MRPKRKTKMEKNYISDDAVFAVEEKLKAFLKENKISVERVCWPQNSNFLVYVKNGFAVIEGKNFFKAHWEEIQKLFLETCEEFSVKEFVLKDYFDFCKKIGHESDGFDFEMIFYSEADKKVNEFIRKNKSKAVKILRELLPGKISHVYCHSFTEEPKFFPCGFYVFINSMENFESLDEAQQKNLEEDFFKRFKEFDLENILCKENIVLDFLPGKDKNGKNLIEYGFTRED